ncbi:hypothetical protein DPMN_076766 [Dreissena polymorpha]|uniref:Uncharacterized protein n=1 Tax=Dreissena polymorpha TaxID=45954 RepID=A0A9D3YM60_DREPO|nr:hypothetical protein DPMN_076766 [Dreissena polymorpha]
MHDMLNRLQAITSKLPWISRCYNEQTSLDKTLFSEIRNYEENTVLTWPTIRKSQRPDGYRSNFCLRQRSDISILYHKGDIYIVWIAPVHNTGTTPLKCAKMREDGLDIGEAIRYGIFTGSGLFGGAKIGLILIDSCSDPQIRQEKILTLHLRCTGSESTTMGSMSRLPTRSLDMWVPCQVM